MEWRIDSSGLFSHSVDLAHRCPGHFSCSYPQTRGECVPFFNSQHTHYVLIDDIAMTLSSLTTGINEDAFVDILL